MAVVEVVEYDERWPRVFKELCEIVGPALAFGMLREREAIYRNAGEYMG